MNKLEVQGNFEIDFTTWQGTPQPAKRIVEYIRRPGGSTLYPHYLGTVSNTWQATATLFPGVEGVEISLNNALGMKCRITLGAEIYHNNYITDFNIRKEVSSLGVLQTITLTFLTDESDKDDIQYNLSIGDNP